MRPCLAWTLRASSAALMMISVSRQGETPIHPSPCQIQWFVQVGPMIHRHRPRVHSPWNIISRRRCLNPSPPGVHAAPYSIDSRAKAFSRMYLTSRLSHLGVLGCHRCHPPRSSTRSARKPTGECGRAAVGCYANTDPKRQRMNQLQTLLPVRSMDGCRTPVRRLCTALHGNGMQPGEKGPLAGQPSLRCRQPCRPTMSYPYPVEIRPGRVIRRCDAPNIAVASSCLFMHVCTSLWVVCMEPPPTCCAGTT